MDRPNNRPTDKPSFRATQWQIKRLPKKELESQHLLKYLIGLQKQRKVLGFRDSWDFFSINLNIVPEIPESRDF